MMIFYAFFDSIQNTQYKISTYTSRDVIYYSRCEIDTVGIISHHVLSIITNQILTG